MSGGVLKESSEGHIVLVVCGVVGCQVMSGAAGW